MKKKFVVLMGLLVFFGALVLGGASSVKAFATGSSILVAQTPAAPSTQPGQPAQKRGHGHRDNLRRLYKGLNHLKACHRILNSMAGTHYGGHRAQADQLVQQAIAEVQQAIQYARQHRNQAESQENNYGGH